MEPSSTPRSRAPADVTSTPKASSPTSSRCPLLSPISPGESVSFLTSCEPLFAWRETTDSGFGPSHSALSFRDASSLLPTPLLPLSIDIPPPISPGEAPTSREVMFAALDENFARYVRYMGRRGRPVIGGKVGLPALDIVSALLDADASGFLLRSHLFPLLSPCDLRRMRLVSQRWRLAVSRHSQGRWRHLRGKTDENAAPSEKSDCSGLCDSGLQCSSPTTAVPSPSFLRPGALRTTQSTSYGDDKTSEQSLSVRQRFQTASFALLASEHLTRCPSCAFPARISPRRRSTHCETVGGCGGVFCRSCGFAQHEDEPCRMRLSPTQEPPPQPPSSPEKRQRKKLLKRL